MATTFSLQQGKTRTSHGPIPHPLTNCFSYRNVSQNAVNALSKMVFKNPVFYQTSSRFRALWPIQFCSNSTSMWSKWLSNNVWRYFRRPMSAEATVAEQSFNGKFTAKIDYHRWCWHWKSKFSPYIIWWVFGPNAGEIWKKSYGLSYSKFWAFWQKLVNYFWQSVDANLKDVSVTEPIVWCLTINLKTIIFHYSKKYGSPTRVTRLKWHQTWQTQSVLKKRDRSIYSIQFFVE